MNGFGAWFSRRRELMGFSSQRALASAARISLKTVQVTESSGSLADKSEATQMILAWMLRVSMNRLVQISEGVDDGAEYLVPGRARIDPPDEFPDMIDATVLRQIINQEGRKNYAGLVDLPIHRQVECLAMGWLRLSETDKQSILLDALRRSRV